MVDHRNLCLLVSSRRSPTRPAYRLTASKSPPHGGTTDLFSRKSTAWYDPQLSDPFSGFCFSSSHRPCPFVALTLSRLRPFIFIRLGSQAVPPQQTRLPATLAKACTVTRTTDAIQTRLGSARPPAPTPRRLVLSPNDPWSFTLTTMTTMTTKRLNNQSTHYHPTGPNGLSPETSVGATARQ